MAMTDQLRAETGPRTAMGELLRRSWHPIALGSALTEKDPIKGVRVLSENLVLYRTKGGAIGLVQDACTHHGVPLRYGYVEENCITCSWHGWSFDLEGNCFILGYQSKIYPIEWGKANAYPVRRYAGLYWAYLGPLPAPALPDYEVLTRRDGRRRISTFPNLACNWLAAGDDGSGPRGTGTLDDSHLYLATAPTAPSAGCLWLRMPIDDTHTWQLVVDFFPSPDGAIVEPEEAEAEEGQAAPEDSGAATGVSAS